MKNKRLLVLLLLLPFGFAKAQTASSFTQLLNNLKQYDKVYPREKVHLHFDKPYYALGDTVWFEAYIVNAANNVPSDRSAILHVELINSKDSICKALQLPISVGYAPGDFTLTDSLLMAGNYRIRAYTNWMRNFDPDYFFTKDIMVVNPFPPKDQTATTANAQLTNTKTTALPQKGYDIQFFPESGELVNGITSTVAFKAVAGSGYGSNVTGKLIDDQNKPVLDFKTDHAGMGSFSLTPVKGKSYTAVVQMPDGDTKNINLPKAAESGYVITTDISNPDSLTVTLLTSADCVGREEMILMPLSNGEPLFFYKTNFPDKRVNITAPRSKLPGGMLQFTLFNSKNEPVAERLVFNTYQKANLAVTDVKPSHEKRSKAELNLQATDGAGNPLIGSFSMSVINADDIAENEQAATTIFSNLLLTSDLKGYIENPNYYFTDPSPEKNKQLDNLLLTQGYRRFVWKDVANANYPQITYPLESAITLSGTVTRNNKSVIAGVHVSLFPEKTGGGPLLDTVTDAQGHFIFKLPYNAIDTRYVAQAKEKGLQILHINLDSYQPAKITPLQAQYADMAATETTDNYIKATAESLTASGKNINFNKMRYLKEVEIKDYRPKNKLPADSHSYNLNGPGKADYVLTSKDVEKCADLTCLTAMLPLAANNLKTLRGGVLLIIDGADAGVAAPGDPRSLLVSMVPPSSVESIEFMKAGSVYASIYGIRGSGGVLVVTTKRGPDRERDTTTVKNRKYVALPVYTARQFHSPQYNDSTGQGNFNKTRTLKEVEIKDYRPKNKLPADSHSDNLNGPGKADYVLTAKDLESCANIECLTSLLPLKANFLNNKGELLVLIDGTAVKLPLPILYNDDPLSGLTALISPTEIESVEFMKGNGPYSAIYGLRGSAGVLSFTTKRGRNKVNDTTTANNRRRLTPPVYMAREFYAPKYDNPATQNKDADLRTTIYWDPEVITGKDGKAKVHFYNNDVPGNYRVIIEGITAEGVLGRGVFNYKVE